MAELGIKNEESKMAQGERVQLTGQTDVWLRRFSIQFNSIQTVALQEKKNGQIYLYRARHGFVHGWYMVKNLIFT
ncbi:MAG: hypothetical protein LBR26_06875 [Prevotella sp.]|nr:hypothetical protein [Prevotella sp.]